MTTPPNSQYINLWIPSLPAAATLNGTELLLLEQLGASRKLALAAIVTYLDAFFDPLGAAAAVLASSLQKAANLGDLTNVATARANLGIANIPFNGVTRAISANYVVDPTDGILLANAGAGEFSITFPTSLAGVGQTKTILIQKTGTDQNPIDIYSSAAPTVPLLSVIQGGYGFAIVTVFSSNVYASAAG